MLGSRSRASSASRGSGLKTQPSGLQAKLGRYASGMLVAADRKAEVKQREKRAQAGSVTYEQIEALISSPLVKLRPGVLDCTQEEFRTEIQRLKHRLQTQHAGLLNPSAWYMQVWDIVTSVALLFVAFVTPFEGTHTRAVH